MQRYECTFRISDKSNQIKANIGLGFILYRFVVWTDVRNTWHAKSTFHMKSIVKKKTYLTFGNSEKTYFFETVKVVP